MKKYNKLVTFSVKNSLWFLDTCTKKMNKYQKYNDGQLLALLREKAPVNNYAFNELYGRYSKKLYAYCLFRAENRLDAEDLHQETWVRFCRYVETNENSINLPSYLFKIAKNLQIDKLRVKKDKLTLSIEQFDFENFRDDYNLPLEFENKELMRTVLSIINNMKDIHKDILLLKWFSGLSYQEIAEIYNETPAFVRKRSSRAMAELIKFLNPLIKEIAGDRK